MRTIAKRTGTHAGNVAETVRARIESGGERFWCYADFRGLPFSAVAKTLSRLARGGTIQRLGKGIYYRPRVTTFGPSRPNMAKLRSLSLQQKAAFPAGTAAANLLGFTTQNPARIELATDAACLPRLFLGKDRVVHAGRPAAWRTLSETDAVLLDFIRNRGASSEMSPAKTVGKLLQLFREPERFGRLLKVARTEPPRVRAMLGAIGEQAGQPEGSLATLRASLNPLSRYDFGILAALAHARKWQAKERQAHEAV